MKIIQGPSEQNLHDYTLQHFRKTLRVKPSASRQQSSEIYYLCLDYDNSLDPVAIRTKEFQNRLKKVNRMERQAQESGRDMSKADAAEANQLYGELMELSQNDLKEFIKQQHAKGEDCKYQDKSHHNKTF